MANTTSGTVTFDKSFAVDDLIAEAYERIGSQVTSGYQLKSARRSLNILFQEWGNRGLHYWEVGETNIDLIEGQAEYTFYRASGDGSDSHARLDFEDSDGDRPLLGLVGTGYWDFREFGGLPPSTDANTNGDINMVVDALADDGNMYTVIAEFQKIY